MFFDDVFYTIKYISYHYTLGRKIVTRQELVNIFGRPYELKAEVIEINAFSAHAGEKDLVRFVRECGDSLKKVFIVHGEPKQSEELLHNIHAMNIKAIVPKKHETVYLAAD